MVGVEGVRCYHSLCIKAQMYTENRNINKASNQRKKTSKETSLVE